MNKEPTNYAHHWCEHVVELLIELSADHFFLAPGSRSTPLVSAVARNARARIVHAIDERSLGFLALGYSKRAQKPAVVIVTSGTAVSNLYPAVTEAYISGVPMLVISADRPFELRNCGANQTINQARMFEHHVVHSFDLAPPSPVVPLAMSLAIIEQAYYQSLQPRLGPVHINVQLREPVANLPHALEPAWSPVTLPQKKLSIPRVTNAFVDVTDLRKICANKKGLIVVGELMPSRVQEQIGALAKKWSWPIIADVTSNMRFFAHPNLINQGDLLLLNPEFVAALNVDVVMKFGARMVSKRLWSWIEHTNATCIAVSECYERIDHVARFTHVHVNNLSNTLDALLQTSTQAHHDWSPLFSRAKRVHEFLAHYFETNKSNEAYLATRLIANISEPVNLFVSSSMPIRDLDQFPHTSSQRIDVFANRGASGIDGVISSSIGMAIADQKPSIVLIGDMAFLHDANGLMALRQSGSPMLIVVINNGGGVIFHFLPIASEQDVLTPYLDSPHDVHLAALCSAYHVAHRAVSSMSDFDEEMTKFFRERTSRVIEVNMDKASNVAAHRYLYSKLANLSL